VQAHKQSRSRASFSSSLLFALLLLFTLIVFFLLFALRSCCLATHASDNDDNDNDNVSTFESPPFLPREAAIVIGFNLAAPVTGSLVPQVCPWPPFNLPWPSSHDLDASTPLLKSPLAGGLIA